jgi:hypothetical protein
MAKQKEKIIKEFEQGAFKIVLLGYYIGDRLIKLVLYVWRGTKQVLKKSYPTVHKGLVAFDNALERFIKDTTGHRVDVPIVKG